MSSSVTPSAVSRQIDEEPDTGVEKKGAAAALPVPVAGVPLLDRDHSILAFNERVLDWAMREDVPLPILPRRTVVKPSKATACIRLRRWHAKPTIWSSGNTPCTTIR